MSKLRGIKLHFMSFCLAVFAIFSTFFLCPLDVSAESLGLVTVGSGRQQSDWFYGKCQYFDTRSPFFVNEENDNITIYEDFGGGYTYIYDSVINVPFSFSGFPYKFDADVSSVIMSLTSNIIYGFTTTCDSNYIEPFGDGDLSYHARMFVKDVSLIINGAEYRLPFKSLPGSMFNDMLVEGDAAEFDSPVSSLDIGSYISFDLNNLKDISVWDCSLCVTFDMTVAFTNGDSRVKSITVEPWVNWYVGTNTETFKFYTFSDGSEELQKDLIALQQQQNTLQQTENNLQTQGNQIAQQTQKDINSGFGNLANGFDSSAGDSMNDGFNASLNNYEVAQDSLFTAAQSGLNGFNFVDFSSYPALVTSMSFVTSLMTSFFGAMGGESGPVGIILSVLFSVMLVSMAIGLYRFYSGKKDGDG